MHSSCHKLVLVNKSEFLADIFDKRVPKFIISNITGSHPERGGRFLRFLNTAHCTPLFFGTMFTCHL